MSDFLRFGCERESKKEWCIKRVEKGLCKIADTYFGGLWHEIDQGKSYSPQKSRSKLPRR